MKRGRFACTGGFGDHIMRCKTRGLPPTTGKPPLKMFHSSADAKAEVGRTGHSILPSRSSARGSLPVCLDWTAQAEPTSAPPHSWFQPRRFSGLVTAMPVLKQAGSLAARLSDQEHKAARWSSEGLRQGPRS